MSAAAHRPPPRPAAPVSPAPMSPAVLELLDRAGASLLHASHCGDAGERYVAAHLGALRAAAAVLAARTSPSRPSRPRSVWEVLPVLAPELTEWAIFFTGSGRRRVAIERGERTPAAREADDLLRQAEAFLDIVHDLLVVPRAVPLAAYLTPVSAVRHASAG